MAACSSKEGVRVENSENYDEIMEFESCVDEHEALASLGALDRFGWLIRLAGER